MKRKFTDDEKRISQHSIDRLQEEINDTRNIHLAKAIIDYNYTLEYSYRKQKKEYKEAIKQFEENLLQKLETIRILKDQIKNGVEIKENKQVG